MSRMPAEVFAELRKMPGNNVSLQKVNLNCRFAQTVAQLDPNGLLCHMVPLFVWNVQDNTED